MGQVKKDSVNPTVAKAWMAQTDSSLPDCSALRGYRKQRKQRCKEVLEELVREKKQPIANLAMRTTMASCNAQ